MKLGALPRGTHGRTNGRSAGNLQAVTTSAIFASRLIWQVMAREVNIAPSEDLFMTMIAGIGRVLVLLSLTVSFSAFPSAAQTAASLPSETPQKFEPVTASF